MRVLLVASAGGHLNQLRNLSRYFSPTPTQVLWVTDVDSTAMQDLAAAGHQVVGAHTPNRRSLVNLFRNFRLAVRTIREFRPDVVVSTGAALAPPFLLAGRMRRVRALFIESVTFDRGPSVSGRLASLIPGVNLCHQTDPAAFGSRWVALSSPFDRFQVEGGIAASLQTPLRVFVSLGTQAFPFERLVARVEQICEGHEVDVTWQLGFTATSFDKLPGRVAEFLSYDEWTELAKRSDVVVGHAGAGLVLSSLEAGIVPVICPRDPGLGEHIDDHQEGIAAQVRRRKLGVVRSPRELQYEDLESAARMRVVTTDAPAPKIDLPHAG